MRKPAHNPSSHIKRAKEPAVFDTPPLCLAVGGGAELPPPAVRNFVAAFEEKLADSSTQLDEMKASHRHVDDELGRTLEGLSGQLNRAVETQSLKADLLQRNLARLDQLEHQVFMSYTLCPVPSGL